MLTIRLQRVGRKNQPSYRVIVTPKGRGGPKGKPVEYLGWLNPLKKTFALKKERIQYWLSQGAKTSATLHNLLVKAGVIKGSKIPVHKKSAPKEPAPAPEASVQAPNETVLAQTTSEPAPGVISESAPAPSTESKPEDQPTEANTS